MTMMRSVVLGYGSYLPERILTNAELAKMVDTSDEWIVQRTGIKERHIAAEGEFTSHLGLKAAQQAKSDAAVAVFGQQADVEDTQFVRPVIDVQAPDRALAIHDHGQVGIGILGFVPGLLRPELQALQQGFGGEVAAPHPDFGAARAGIKVLHERQVARFGGPHLNRARGTGGHITLSFKNEVTACPS